MRDAATAAAKNAGRDGGVADAAGRVTTVARIGPDAAAWAGRVATRTEAAGGGRGATTKTEERGRHGATPTEPRCVSLIFLCRGGAAHFSLTGMVGRGSAAGGCATRAGARGLDLDNSSVAGVASFGFWGEGSFLDEEDDDEAGET